MGSTDGYVTPSGGSSEEGELTPDSGDEEAYRRVLQQLAKKKNSGDDPMRYCVNRRFLTNTMKQTEAHNVRTRKEEMKSREEANEKAIRMQKTHAADPRMTEERKPSLERPFLSKIIKDVLSSKDNTTPNPLTPLPSETADVPSIPRSRKMRGWKSDENESADFSSERNQTPRGGELAGRLVEDRRSLPRKNMLDSLETPSDARTREGVRYRRAPQADRPSPGSDRCMGEIDWGAVRRHLGDSGREAHRKRNNGTNEPRSNPRSDRRSKASREPRRTQQDDRRSHPQVRTPSCEWGASAGNGGPVEISSDESDVVVLPSLSKKAGRPPPASSGADPPQDVGPSHPPPISPPERRAPRSKMRGWSEDSGSQTPPPRQGKPPNTINDSQVSPKQTDCNSVTPNVRLRDRIRAAHDPWFEPMGAS